MRIPVTNDIHEAARVIREGRVVAFPTGTSYGLAVAALSGHALQRLRNLKERPQEKTFTVFMRPTLWDTHLIVTKPELVLLQHMRNQPLTLLVCPNDTLAHLAQEGRIGVRVIDHPLMEQLAAVLDVPLTATSANKSGKEPCRTPACIEQTFPWRIDESTYDLSLGCILDGGTLPQRQPTTIARLDDDKAIIVRQGGISKEDIIRALTI